MTQSSNYVAQVGGAHYGTKYGHWDFCKDADVPYLEGSATKYVYRWRKKAGIEDLKKAQSFVAKLMVGNGGTKRGLTVRHLLNHDKLNRFFDENIVAHEERAVIQLIVFWKDYNDLVEAYCALSNMIGREQDLIPTATMPKEEEE